MHTQFYKGLIPALTTVIYLLLLWSPSAHADGAFLGTTELGRWDYVSEESQSALITHENGLQKMLLSASAKATEGKSLIWIFPVPAAPQNVTIDISSEMPKMYGEQIHYALKRELKKIRYSLFKTQLYTIQPKLGKFYSVQRMMFGAAASLGSGNENASSVVVHEHIDKDGIVSELITAKNGADIYDYLRKNGINAENGSIQILDKYISQDFSFVVSRISPQEVVVSTKDVAYYLQRENRTQWPLTVKSIYEAKEREYPRSEWWRLKNDKHIDVFDQIVTQVARDTTAIRTIKQYLLDRRTIGKGILVSFPSSNIYFPLLLTSVYGDRHVPLSIKVLGFASPVLFNEIKKYSTVEYYMGSGWKTSPALTKYFNTPSKFEYTKIDIDAPSNSFVQDLTITNTAPIKIQAYRHIIRYPSHLFWPLLILLSAAAGILVGCGMFPELRTVRGAVRFGVIGLGNCLSIIGVLFFTNWLLPKHDDPTIKEVLEALKRKGYYWKRRVGTILLSMMFLAVLTSALSYMAFLDYHHEPTIGILSIVVAFILFAPGAFATFLLGGHAQTMLIVSLLVFLYFVSVTVRCLHVEPEDKALFEKLRAANYSTTLLPYGSSFEFAYYFSTVFIVTAFLATWW
ncbi:MAG: hypothetical protein AB7V08_09520 [Elusimicrobiales bacterium]